MKKFFKKVLLFLVWHWYAWPIKKLLGLIWLVLFSWWLGKGFKWLFGGKKSGLKKALDRRSYDDFATVVNSHECLSEDKDYFAYRGICANIAIFMEEDDSMQAASAIEEFLFYNRNEEDTDSVIHLLADALENHNWFYIYIPEELSGGWDSLVKEYGLNHCCYDLGVSSLRKDKVLYVQRNLKRFANLSI